eukprot:TRINITY_DN13258_c0_g1_i1.p1 TRINITY_DN13258_c0_g1~~TRINITY_DN13258_c0_g1_i1.p1  ORF type:complete len:272 (+),score=39.07 TRINITY_DN13258_c0_g1_i1:66-818(+)
MAPSMGGRFGLSSVAASLLVSIAATVAALAASGAAAAAGLAALLATSVAVVGSGGDSNGRSDEAAGARAQTQAQEVGPCWFGYCSRQGDVPTSSIEHVFDATLAVPGLAGGAEVIVDSDLCCGAQHRRAPKVRFNLGKNTVHEITPYSEVYGTHPRYLRIKPGAQQLQRFDQLTDDSDSDEEDGCSDGFSRLSSSSLERWEQASWKFWPLLAACSFIISAFGPQAFMELLPGIGEGVDRLKHAHIWLRSV